MPRGALPVPVFPPPIPMTAPVPAATDEQPIEAPVQPAPALPDRADAPVTEVAERFLRAVVAQVPIELIEELHLFSPLRQGTVETGIAVVAVKVPVLAEVEASEAGEPQLPWERAVRAGEGGAGEAEADGTGAGETGAGISGEGEGDGLIAGDGGTAEAREAEARTAETDGRDVVVEGDVTIEVGVVAAEGDDDEDVSYVDEMDVVVSADEGDEAEALEIVAAPVKLVRHTVYTARYRYVIKGPERGKWEASIKAEAEAPLITVETVVRGVQRRAGEESEIVRYTAAQIARALRVPLPA
jgi:hypothetical protein